MSLVNKHNDVELDTIYTKNPRIHFEVVTRMEQSIVLLATPNIKC